MYSLFGLLNDNIGSSLRCDLVDQNANLGTFLTIDVNFFFSVLTPACLREVVELPAKIESIHPFFCLSVPFLGIGLLVFF